jgi:hypothetical protein
LEGLAETILQLIPDESAAPGLWVDRVRVDMPVELYVRRRGGRWQLDSSAPTQRIKTGLVPVFHRVEVALAIGAQEATND